MVNDISHTDVPPDGFLEVSLCIDEHDNIKAYCPPDSDIGEVYGGLDQALINFAEEAREVNSGLDLRTRSDNGLEPVDYDTLYAALEDLDAEIPGLRYRIDGEDVAFD